jgi:fructoselysine 6-kinase
VEGRVLEEMMRVGAVGDNVVDIYRDSGLMYPGGGAANVAVQASRFGCEAIYIGAVGLDVSGQHVWESLIAEGVDLKFSRRVDAPNAVTNVSIDESGDRIFVSNKSISSDVNPTETDFQYLKGCSWLYTNYSSGVESKLVELSDVAPLAFDFSYRGLDYAKPLLPSVSIAAFSRDDLDDEETTSFVRMIQNLGPETVLVTRGAKGAVVAQGKEIVHQQAENIVPIDTLGAGDAFLARFVNGTYSGEGIAAAARSASEWAANVCLHFGAFGHPKAISTERKSAQNALGD